MANETRVASAGRLPCGGTPYEDVAKVIKAAMKRRPPEMPRLSGMFAAVPLIDDLTNLFAANNPTFDRQRFLTACGLESEA